MKKFLSLVLALVMTMSLVTVSAGAKDFTDDSSITYDEAVAVMSAVGVIDGYTDGSFQPTTNLTRGAAAKIICNLILGPTTAAALGADTAPYSDVPVSNVFSGYIAYCQKEGIISGYADGTFRPSAPLTGYAFMKMLLGALGYDSAKEGYTGANWSINVAKQAIAIGLDDGNDDFVGQASVNREEAMLYAFNTMKATMVEYGNDTTITVGDVVVSQSGKASEVANTGKSDGNVKDDNKMQFAEKYFTDLKKTADGTDVFGRPASTWKVKNDTIGTYADDSTLVGSYTEGVDKGDLYDLVGKDTYDEMNKDGSLTVYLNGKDQKAVRSDYFVKNSSATAESTGNGVLTEVYVDDEDNVSVVIVPTYLMQATADYNEKKETLSVDMVDNGMTDPGLPNTISIDDFDVSDYSEDDYLLVTFADDEVQSVAAAEVVTGEVSTYSNKTTDDASKTVTVDGTKYKYTSGVDTDAIDYTIGEEAAVVLDAYGYIIAVDEATVSGSNFVFIKDIAGTSNLAKNFVADAYFTDGTNKEITLKKIGDTSKDLDKPANEGKWYTYSVNSSDEYTLKVVADSDAKYTQTGTSFDHSSTVMTGGKVNFSGSFKGNNATVFVVLGGDGDVTVYTGIAKAPTIKTSAGVTDDKVTMDVIEKDGFAAYVFVDAYADDDVEIDDDSTATANYIFVLKQGDTVKESADLTYVEFDVIMDGEEKTIKAEDKDTFEVGKLYSKVKTNSDELYCDPTLFKDAADTDIGSMAQAVKYSNGALSIGGKSYVLADDADINLVITEGASILLKDQDADYETYLGITGRALAANLEEREVSGTYYAVLDDDDSSVITKLYVYVTSAEASDSEKLENAVENAVESVKDAVLSKEDTVITDLYLEGKKLNVDVTGKMEDTDIVDELAGDETLAELIEKVTSASCEEVSKTDAELMEVVNAIKSDLNDTKIATAMGEEENGVFEYNVELTMDDESVVTYTLVVNYTYTAE